MEQKINSYLTFSIGDESFAAHVGKVINILELSKITQVPRTPEFMLGVINLRGTVLPVVDTRIKFGLDVTEFTSQTCIIVMEIDMEGDVIKLGALVDGVQEVLEVDDAEIKPPPSIGSKFKSEFIKGMIKVDDSFIMLLDMDKAFSTEELIALKDNNTEQDENKE